MIFTEQEIKRLEELAAWGIKKGIQDPDLKSADAKLRRILRAREDAKIFLADPDHGSRNNNSYINTNLVMLTERFLGRPIHGEESDILTHLLKEGCSFEDIRFGYEQCISDLGNFQMQYVVEILVKELGIKPDEHSLKYMKWNSEC